MLLRLFKSNVVKSILQRCPDSRPIACRISSLRPVSNYSGSSFFKKSDSKLLGVGTRQSLSGGISQVGCVRPYHKLFVKDLPLDATEELVRQHFSQYGMVLSVRIIRNPNTMGSERHGFVAFADKEALEKVVSSQPHSISNQPVIIRPVQEISFLVTELSPSSTEQSLRAYFSRYGTVLKCILKRDPIKGINSGFVDISDSDEMDKELVSKMHVIDGQQVKVVRVMPKELTLFVGNLSPTTTDQSLHAFYSQFGNILQAEVKRDRLTGQSRCFGFVSFSCHQELDNALRSLPHIIDGEEVKINHSTREFTLFITDLPTDMSVNRLREYFEQFGPVYRCDIARDKQTDQLLHYGWVTFSSQQGLNGALVSLPLVIDGKQIDIKRIPPKELSLFVGNLSPATTEQSLQAFYSQFGNILQAEVKRYRLTGQSRCFGFVSFSCRQELDNALLLLPHIIDGEEVKINHSTREFTLFITDLSTDMSVNRLREYFEQFGPVHYCDIVRDKQTNQLLHYGWVTFSSQQGLNGALASRPLVIDGKQIDAKSGKKQVADGSTLFVERLSHETTDQMLYEAFSKFGTVVRSEVKLDPLKGQSMGFGYVTYSCPNEVYKALRARPHVVDGCVLNVFLHKDYVTPSSSRVAKKNY